METTRCVQIEFVQLDMKSSEEFRLRITSDDELIIESDQ